jgi:putative transposase
MPWEARTAMDQRRRFILAFETCRYTMTELCRVYGISRKTGYKWANRFAAEGPDVAEHSRAPHSCPHQTDPQCVEALVEYRRQHPRWGAAKLLRRLSERQPDWLWPARSTATEILKRHGLVEPRRRTRRPSVGARPELSAEAANDLWTADFKGQFRTGDRQMCYPLTVADYASRYLLACQVCDSVAGDHVRPAFEALFRQVGLPRRILTDNGPPFGAPRAPRRLSRLAVWWIKLGIEPVRTQPGHPEQNGAHERLHRTLKAETARPPAKSLGAQQSSFDSFRAEYNDERPHEALGLRRPAELYLPSLRPYPAREPAVDYPGHFEIRRVRSKGGVRWRGTTFFLSEVLRGEPVGFEEVDDGLWSVCFSNVLLGRYDERDRTFLAL